MQDSDQFFKMIFQMKSNDNEHAQASDNQEELEEEIVNRLEEIAIKRREDAQRKQDLPRAIRASFEHIDDFEDMYAMIFLYVIEYYRDKKSFDDLLKNRKNLKSMLQSLHDNFSNQKNALIFKDPFEKEGIVIVYNLMSRFSKELSEKLVENQKGNH